MKILESYKERRALTAELKRKEALIKPLLDHPLASGEGTMRDWYNSLISPQEKLRFLNNTISEDVWTIKDNSLTSKTSRSPEEEARLKSEYHMWGGPT